MAVVIRKRSAAVAGSAPASTQHSAVPRQLRPQARVIDLQWQLWAISARGTDGRTLFTITLQALLLYTSVRYTEIS